MPYPENAPRVDDLISMPPQEIAALTAQLGAIDDDIAAIRNQLQPRR